MNYEEALAFIHDTHKFSIKLGLDNVSHLLRLMGNPQEDLKVIHVAGTNGKGSTSSYINEVLIEAGYKVGLYTSPFLEVFNERMRIGNVNISNEELAEITAFTKACIQQMLEQGLSHPTEFEIVTAIAFEYYKRHQVDFVVLEVGMGGRLDSTNVIKSPLVSVITPVDLDHVEYLGDTVEKVAGEKAGIIKMDCPCVIHPQLPEAQAVIESVAQSHRSRLIVANTAGIEKIHADVTGTLFKSGDRTIRIKMLGEHQTRNAVVAITALDLLVDEGHARISEDALLAGIGKAKWAGRLEVMSESPLVIIDGAHNLHGARGLSQAVRNLLANRKIIAVVGILGDKDISGMLSEMMPLCQQVICTEPDNPRKMTAENLAAQVAAFGIDALVEPSIENAFALARSLAAPEDAIICFGSLYMIGTMRTAIRNFKA